jgi:hypothetical protein
LNRYLLKQTEKQEKSEKQQLDFFSDFNGLPGEAAKTEFYQHDANWSNRMILGDSLQVPHITFKSIANNAEIDVIWDDIWKDRRKFEF